jgi:tRNA (guanine-N7-)-methyltransferase
VTDDDAPSVTGPPPGVRTTRRRGRTSAAKTAVLDQLGPAWTLPAAGPWDAAALDAGFGQGGPLRVDIGVGSGEATRAWAVEAPEARVLAIELHRPGLAKLLGALEADGPANVRVVEADALGVLEQLDPGSVAALRLLFPDPWPKRRHVERRMVDRAFVGLAARVLEPGGQLHLATDWADYAEHMRTMVATEPRLARVLDAGRPARPVTTYERRGLELGRTITDLVYRLDA